MRTALTDHDKAILANVDMAIRQGRELNRWWQGNKSAVTRIPFMRQLHNPPEWNFGFLENAVTSAGSLPVAGVSQCQLYSSPEGPGAAVTKPDIEFVRRQAREFMMRHFMRLTSAKNPAVAEGEPALPKARPGAAAAKRHGWGYQQVLYKLAKNGRIGKFPEDQQTQIVDLRDIGPVYDWIVFQVRIFGFDITVDLSPGDGPKLQVSTEQPVYTVLTPEFVVENPKDGIRRAKDGVVASYGYGYSVVPDTTRQSIIAALPSSIDNTLETLRLDVHEDGRIWACMDFITPQPARILNLDPVSLGFRVADFFSFGAASRVLAPVKKTLTELVPSPDPVYAGISLLNAATANAASDYLSIDKRHLFMKLMALHYTDVYDMYNLSASHFRQIDDWTDKASLPEWARFGTFTPGEPS